MANPVAVVVFVLKLVTVPTTIRDPTVNAESMYSSVAPFHPLGTRVPRTRVIGALFGLCSPNFENAESSCETTVLMPEDGLGSRPVVAALIEW